MRRLGQHSRLPVFDQKEGAAKVQPFLDIRAVGSAAQRNAHLLGDEAKGV